MALRVTEKIISRLNFLYRKNQFLDVPLRRLLCNALIQLHFDYNCTAWYPDLTKKKKEKRKALRYTKRMDQNLFEIKM